MKWAEASDLGTPLEFIDDGPSPICHGCFWPIDDCRCGEARESAGREVADAGEESPTKEAA